MNRANEICNDDEVSASEQKIRQGAAAGGKKLMNENAKRINTVWHAFVKFVKNQVCVNGRLVDTSLIGLFFNDA